MVGMRYAALAATLALLVMFTGSCLITSDIEFSEPERGTPMIIADTAAPDPDTILKFDLTALDNLSMNFSAEVRSEDAGQPLRSQLIFNYGVSDGIRPYENATPSTAIGAGTWDGESRLVSQSWRGNFFDMKQVGCYRLTLMVGHSFDKQGCPEQDDYDAVSWIVLVCQGEDCPDVTTDCPVPTNDCRNLPEIAAQ